MGTIKARGIATLVKVSDGNSASDPVYIIISNESSTVSADNKGWVTDYRNTVTDIHVYEGVNELSYTESPITVSNYNISVSGNDITPGLVSKSSSGIYASLGPSSHMVADNARITVRVTGVTSQGNSFTVDRVITISKSIAGSQGEQGPAAPIQYTHIAYANSADGNLDFSTSNSDRDYIGMFVNNTKEDSESYLDYAWTLVKGADGSNGTPGKPGVDGKTPYLHIAYADDDKGTNFSTTDATNRDYLGQYTDYLQKDSTSYLDYLWSKIKGDKGERGIQGLQGEDGTDGIPGTPGKDGIPSYTHIAYSDSADGNTNFSTSNTDRAYIGMYTDSSSKDSNSPSDYGWSLIKGADGSDGTPGKPGVDGKTPYLHIAYADSADGVTGFSVSNSTNKYYIGQYTDYNQVDSTNPASYSWTLIKGPKGDQGLQGLQGYKGEQGLPGPKGSDSYTHIAYADSADGNTNFSVSDPSRDYIGVYVDSKANDSTNPNDYAWTLVKGADGSDGTPGKPGIDGKTPYLHIAYADSSDGKSNFSVSNPGDRAYIGQYTDYIQSDSSNPSIYKWSLIKGLDGKDAPLLTLSADRQVLTYDADNKANPASQKITFSVVIQNLTGTPTFLATPFTDTSAGNPITLSGSGLTRQLDISQVATSVTSVVVTATLGSLKDTVTITKVKNGSAGNGVVRTDIAYHLSDDGSNPPTDSGWTVSIPPLAAGKYLWTRTIFNYLDNSVKTAYTVARQGADGDNTTSSISSPTPPKSPVKGQWWNDTSSTPNTIKYWDGSQWIVYLLEAVNIKGGTITGDKIAAGSVDANRISVKNSSTGTSQTLDVSLQHMTNTISQTNESINNLQVGGRNLYIVNKSIPGYVNGVNGTISVASSANQEFVSDYIPVLPSTTYIFQAWGNILKGQQYWAGIGQYNASKGFIDRHPGVYNATAATTDTKDYQKTVFTTSGNAGYIRVSSRTFGNYQIKVEQGTLPTDWSPAPEDITTRISISEQTIDGFKKVLQDSAGNTYNDLTTALLSTQLMFGLDGSKSIQKQMSDLWQVDINSSTSPLKTQIAQKADSVTVSAMSNSLSALQKSTQWQQIAYDDLNFLKTQGNYLITSGAGTNSPIQPWFYITVDVPRGDRITQHIWKDLDASASYSRTFNGSSWTAWIQIANSSTLLSIFNDQWSLGTSINTSIGQKIATGIAGLPDGTLALTGKSIHLTGDTIVDGSFMTKALATQDATIGKTLTLGNGGVFKSDSVYFDEKNFALESLNIHFINETVYGNAIESDGYVALDGYMGALTATGTTTVNHQDKFKYLTQIKGGNLYLQGTGWSDGSKDKYVNLNETNFTMLSGSRKTSDAESYTNIGAGGISTKGQIWSDGPVTSGNIVLNGAHSINSADGGAFYFNRKADGSGGLADINAQAGLFGNIFINAAHGIQSNDGGKMYMTTKSGLADLGVKSLTQSSLVSTKEHIGNVDPEYALSETLKADIRQYNFKGDNAENTHVTPMIDDVEGKMYIPKDWVSYEGDSVDTYSIIGYLVQSVKALQAEIDTLKGK